MHLNGTPRCHQYPLAHVPKHPWYPLVTPMSLCLWGVTLMTTSILYLFRNFVGGAISQNLELPVMPLHLLKEIWIRPLPKNHPTLQLLHKSIQKQTLKSYNSTPSYASQV